MNNWPATIRTLEANGWTLTAIAREAESTLGTISDLKHGRLAEPRHSIGEKVLALISRSPAIDAKAA